MKHPERNIPQIDASGAAISPIRAFGVRLPEVLWRRARQASLDHNTTLKDLLITGLELKLDALDVAKGVTQ